MRALRRSLESSGEDSFPNDVLELQAYLGPAAPDALVRAVPGEGLSLAERASWLRWVPDDVLRANFIAKVWDRGAGFGGAKRSAQLPPVWSCAGPSATPAAKPECGAIVLLRPRADSSHRGHADFSGRAGGRP